MNKGVLWFIILILLILVGIFAWKAYGPAPLIAVQQQQTATTSEVQTQQTTTTPTALHDRIVVTAPAKNATVASTFTVTGKVPGNWSFEAQFPVQVRDPDNSKIGQAVATLHGDWMTTNLVPFIATISVAGYHGPATLVLLKDNPSGLPENDDSLEIPIVIQ